MDVIDRAAGDVAVSIDFAGLLGKDSFCVDGGHAKKGDDPHPEDRSRAAGQDRTAGADDIAGADLGGDGGGQGLEGADAAMLFSAVQGEVAEDFLHPFPKTADLYEACTHSEVNARADQQDD